MARKYTKIVFKDDENEIKSIIHDVKPSLKYIRVSYVRDDRVINIKTNEVAVGDNPWQEVSFKNYDDTISLYRHGGDVAIDRLKNGIVNDNGKLIGKKVGVDLHNDGYLEFSIDEYVMMDPIKGHFHIPCADVKSMLEELANIKGYENILDEMRLLYPYYYEYSAQQFARLWFIVHKFNLFDKLEQFANLLTYVEDYRIRDDCNDFWETIKIPEPFRFCLTNYYLSNSNQNERFYLSKFQEDSTLYKFYQGLPTDECRRVFIECAERERYTLRAIETTLSYRTDSILVQIAKAPKFFCDCMEKLNVNSAQDNIIEQFSYYVTQFEKHNMAIEFDNIARLAIVDKANAMGLESSEYFELIDNLNTKEGLLNYLKKEYSI